MEWLRGAAGPTLAIAIVASAACGPAIVGAGDCDPGNGEHNGNPGQSYVDEIAGSPGAHPQRRCPAGSGALDLGQGDEVDDLAAITIPGQATFPRVFDTYGVSGVTSSKPRTLDAERKHFAEVKASAKQSEATVLATMLSAEAGQHPDDRDALLVEARQALAAGVAAAVAAKLRPEALALELLGRYSLFVRDFAGAEDAWATLVAEHPSDERADVFRAWWVYTRLVQFHNAEAAKALDGAVIDKTPELGYVAAWTRWRNGDGAGAWAAMKLAAVQWNDAAAIRDNPERLSPARWETLRFAARTGAPLSDAAAVMTGLAGGQPAEARAMWRELAAAMKLAGRWADAIAADQQALRVGGAAPSGDDAVAILLEQAAFAERLDAPNAVARYAAAALSALATCGSACDAAAAQRAYAAAADLAELMHSIYATANDDRYYRPARDLYKLCVDKITDPGRHAQLADRVNKLELTRQALAPHSGRLGKANTGYLVLDHNQEVRACYEAALDASPAISGTIVLTLDIEQAGRVRNAAAEPELAGVAGCIAAAAKAWKFPARASEGSTRVTVSYVLQPAP
jgi:hypothetical protein